ncbi:MAG: 6-bladed beta-propeller [Rhodothermaceae bacterium]
MKYITMMLFLILFIGCGNKDIKTIPVKYQKSVDLEIQEKLEFLNSDKFFIGGVSKIEVMDNSIFIVDHSVLKIHKFDKNLKLITSYGKKGRGPDEFSRTPKITSFGDTLVIFHDVKNELKFLDENFSVAKVLTYPMKYSTTQYKPVVLNNKILVSAKSEPTGQQEKVSHIYSALILDKNGKVEKEICPFNEMYDNNRNAYIYMNKRSCISGCFNNSFLVKQKADLDFHQFSSDGELINKYTYEPQFYKTPPKIKFGTQYKNTKEYFYKYASKVTHFQSMYFDKKTNLIYINYLDLFPNQYKTRSHLDANNYLMILDSNFRCIFDEKITGKLMDVHKGIVYVMIENSGEKLELLKLKVKFNEK